MADADNRASSLKLPDNIAAELADVEERLAKTRAAREALSGAGIDVSDLDGMIKQGENMIKAIRAAIALRK